MTEVVVKADASGREIALTTHDTVALVLPQNAGTAFLWQLDPNAPVDVVSDRILAADITPGAQASREIRLRPRAAGHHDVRLWRCRPWEDRSHADAEFHVILTVTE